MTRICLKIIICLVLITACTPTQNPTGFTELVATNTLSANSSPTSAPTQTNQVVSLQVSATSDVLSGIAVLPVKFASKVTGGVPPYQYYWDFNLSDGIQIEKNQSTPTWVFGNSGKYTVALDVVDSLGNSGSTSLKIEVLPRTYTNSDPIRLINQHGTAENPIVIEGYEFKPKNDNAIALVNCSYVIIRNNTIHDTNYEDKENGVKGNAIYVQDSSNIEITENVVSNNLKGIWVNSTPNSPVIQNIRIHDNVVLDNVMSNAINVTGADEVEIFNNVVQNNGDLDYFERNRIQGIIAWDSTNIKIHDNLSTGSSSDGIGIATSIEYAAAHPGFLCRNVDIYNNTSIGNGEQGIWLNLVSTGTIHDNFISLNQNPRQDLGSSGIDLEGQIDHLKIFRNKLIDNEIAQITITSSSDNEFYENIMFAPNSVFGGVWINQNPQTYYKDIPPSNNLIRNNVIYGSPIGIVVDKGIGNIIMNNTISNNGPHFSGTGGILIRKEVESTLILNNILSWNKGVGLQNESETSLVAYNDFFKNLPEVIGEISGDGNIFDDPLFLAASIGNYSLMPDSPCRNAADPVGTNGITIQKDMGAIQITQ